MVKKMMHLELIQGVINRMAHCSFLLKRWSVILVSGLFALAAKGADPLFVYLTYLPVIAFWILDGYYLYKNACIVNSMVTYEINNQKILISAWTLRVSRVRIKPHGLRAFYQHLCFFFTASSLSRLSL